jgi:hypothetical protein
MRRVAPTSNVSPASHRVDIEPAPMLSPDTAVSVRAAPAVDPHFEHRARDARRGALPSEAVRTVAQNRRAHHSPRGFVLRLYSPLAPTPPIGSRLEPINYLHTAIFCRLTPTGPDGLAESGVRFPASAPVSRRISRPPSPTVASRTRWPTSADTPFRIGCAIPAHRLHRGSAGCVTLGDAAPAPGRRARGHGAGHWA